jgi:hypothetical protein
MGGPRKRLWLPDERLRDLLKLQDELREQLKTPLVPAPPAGR